MKKKLTKVWRIENAEGTGPYYGTYSDNGVRPWSRRSHKSWKHPLPQAEDLPIHGDLICGFKSLKQLKEWFTAYEIKQMKKLGYKIRLIEAKEVNYGRKQVTFIPKRKKK